MARPDAIDTVGIGFPGQLVKLLGRLARLLGRLV
jgi:hypothetical protein